ncbi:uncharacterized protein EV154DRAFT_571040 [Mucor mucedo]|uniref:uncharacterized protein n=1 Tax=Mucor mucedo TaxID=29922 RepID=UPI00221FE422|nr:uncharacterized protein EV154DRAFT_571040 [Mucor mucedo]KAI7869854.1 hypothetical protein EV154DRAFT_571040 [Mucor mucedo]
MKRKQTKQNNSHRKKKLKSSHRRLKASPTQNTAAHVNAKSNHTRLFLISEQAEDEVISEAVTPISEEANQSTTEETIQPSEEEPDHSEEQINAEHQLLEEPNSSSEDDSSPEHVSSPEDYVSSESSSTTISSPEDGSSNGSNSSEETHLFEEADSPTALIESDEEFTGEDLNRVEGTEVIEEITGEDITPVSETTESEEIATRDDTHHVEETENVESEEATTGEDSNRIEEETHNTEENAEPEEGDTRQEEAATEDEIHTPEETHPISQEETNNNSGTEQVSAAPEEEEAETSGELERINQQLDPPEPSTIQTDIFPLPLVAIPATESSIDILMNVTRAFEHAVDTAIAQLSDNLAAISRQVTSEFDSFEIAVAPSSPSPSPTPPPPQIFTNGLLTEAEALINRHIFDEIQDNEEEHALELGQRQTRVEVPFHHDPPSLGYLITPRTRIPRATNELANGARHLSDITLDTLRLPSHHHSTPIGVEESEDSSDQSDLPTP